MMQFTLTILMSVFGVNVERLDQIGTLTLLVLIILWFIVGGVKEIWVWGIQYRRLEKRLKETEQRLRIMEALALRGTDIADRLAPREFDHEDS